MNAFQSAMLSVQLEDARKKPCVLCERPPFVVGIWTPTASISRRLGADPGKIRVVAYSLCKRCARKKGSRERVEELIIANAESRQAAINRGWEFDGNLTHPPGQPVPEWVREVVAEMGRKVTPEEMTGAEFAWYDEPRCVYLKVRSGEVYGCGEPGHEPPPVPDFMLPTGG